MTDERSAIDMKSMMKEGPLSTKPLRTEAPAPAASANGNETSMSDALRRTGGDVRRALASLPQGTRKYAEGLPVPGKAAAPRERPDASSARVMTPGMVLNPGEQTTSDSGNARLIYQADGNLVLYVLRAGALPTNDPNASWVARWASNTYGQPAGICAMQGDGNLVLYAPDGRPIWSSNTWGHPGAILAVQDDENVVIYEGSNAIWHTNTWIGGTVRSAFDPATMGFRFVNNFSDGYWQFGALRFATAGLCGGMSFSALDYYFAGIPIPATATTPSAVHDPLGQHINARQQESVETNLGGWVVQILNPDDHALHYWSTHDEWHKLKASIDAGAPASIGLGIYLNGGASHQVLATGYREGGQERWIFTYDPNVPSSESHLLLAPGSLHWSDRLGGDWRGFFVSSYTPKTPPT